MIGPGNSNLVNDIDANVTVIDEKIDIIDTNVDQIETLSNTIDGKVDTVDTVVDATKSVVGSFGDYVPVPYVPDGQSLMAFLKTGYFHIHGASFIYPDKAAPVTLTSAIAAWAETGNITEVIPANGITKIFDLHWASLSSISAELDGVIDIFSGGVGAEVKIGSIDVVRTANFSRENAVPVQIPQQAANNRISCRFTDSTASARTVRIKFYGHVYGTSLT